MKICTDCKFSKLEKGFGEKTDETYHPDTLVCNKPNPSLINGNQIFGNTCFVERYWNKHNPTKINLDLCDTDGKFYQEK